MNSVPNTRSKNTRRHLRTSAAIAALAALLACGIAPVRAQTAADVAKGPVIPPSPARLPDGKPNWTGFWVPVVGLLETNIGLGGEPVGAAAAKRPPRPASEFSPLKSPYEQQYAKYTHDVAMGKVADPVALCFPPGMPRMMNMIYGMELLQTPGQIAITSEWQAASRRIWLYRDKHPDPDDLDPSYTGDSIGHWEGDTLVVDTVGIRTDVPVDINGLPHSPKLHLIERWSEKTPGILTDVITIIDPDAFVRPWQQVQTYRYRPDLHIEEYVCLENNRNVGPNGEATFSK